VSLDFCSPFRQCSIIGTQERTASGRRNTLGERTTRKATNLGSGALAISHRSSAGLAVKWWR
jgi:hypothetical protein